MSPLPQRPDPAGTTRVAGPFWNAEQIDAYATEAYAEGRKDEREKLLKLLDDAAAELSSLMDYVAESNAYRMVGAPEAYAEAAECVDAIFAITRPESATKEQA